MVTGLRASVTFYAVVVPVDPFLAVLAGNVRRRMLVTIVTGICFITGWTGMAGSAACPVIPVKRKIPVMIEGRRFPLFRAVACAAARRRCVQVKVVVRFFRFVAGDALPARRGGEPPVIEGRGFPLFRAVACAAARRRCVQVEVVVRFFRPVAGDALPARRGGEPPVIEGCGLPLFRTMACGTIR